MTSGSNLTQPSPAGLNPPSLFWRLYTVRAEIFNSFATSPTVNRFSMWSFFLPEFTGLGAVTKMRDVPIPIKILVGCVTGFLVYRDGLPLVRPQEHDFFSTRSAFHFTPSH
jgi:hypothetical protein